MSTQIATAQASPNIVFIKCSTAILLYRDKGEVCHTTCGGIIRRKLAASPADGIITL
jgi:hypothetical protein